jgi:hypothetical protein
MQSAGHHPGKDSFLSCDTVKLGYNELGYNELGYNELGYNEQKYLFGWFRS